MLTLKLLKLGNSTAVILPKEILVKLNLKEGDTICLTETADGMRITPSDPDFERQMKLARCVAKKRRSALRALAR